MPNRKGKRPYRIWGAYDTETTNITVRGVHRAYPVLYIFNDLHACSMDTYEVDDAREHIDFYRTEAEAVAWLERAIADAAAAGVVPVVCLYNAMFDMQTLMEELRKRHGMKANAQSSTNIYTLDLLDARGRVALRIWDTYHLEMRGLAAMGRTAGVAKLMGDWDYDLVRTPQTDLTEQELGYAARDVQVIPAYLRYLCDANAWLTPDMLGCRVLTKTSLVRQMARQEIGKRTVITHSGKRLRLREAFEALCRQDLPRDFACYALRVACFRGGLTFTSARTASVVVEHVLSLDVTSMHHAFINGRRVPVHFEVWDKRTLDFAIRDISRYGMRDVLRRYHYPFARWCNMAVRMHNVRLKKGSCFETWGISTLAQAKFERVLPASIGEAQNDRAKDAYEQLAQVGYVDTAIGATFAYGKLYACEECIVHVTELELWCIMQVYDYDDIEALSGEGTVRSIWPPDYVALQSNLLFNRKTDAKHIDKAYREGTPYGNEIPDSIPEGIAEGLRDGSISNKFFSEWYSSTVKGSFNGIYGTQSQNVFKPEFLVTDDAELAVNATTRPTPDNLEDKMPEHPMVLYDYGMRIVGGSRMHMVVAMMLLWEALGERVTVTGGDTDSLKVRCDTDVTEADVLAALQPLHVAITDAMDVAQARARATFPDLTSPLTHIGCFEVEPATPTDAYWQQHMEAWNKARVSVYDGHAHVTCAGLSRPQGAYTMEDWLDGMMAEGADPVKLLPLALGYNVTVANEVSHALEHKRPLSVERFEEDVTDYQGNTYHVATHEAVCLYDSGRLLGDTSKRTNAYNVDYLRSTYGRTVDESEKIITIDEDGKPLLLMQFEEGMLPINDKLRRTNGC